MSQHTEQPPTPCLVVIFGASGDLTKRKLLPALYHLRQAGLLPGNSAIVGVARRDLTATFTADMQAGILADGSISPDVPTLQPFLDQISYFPATFDHDADFIRLKDHLATLDQQHSTAGNRLFYLAVAPEAFPDIISRLGTHGLAQPAHGSNSWVRLIIEKPFGTDLTSARQLNAAVAAVFAEDQVFRIDHYLGKDAVQNILTLRFANRVFEPLWHHEHIAKIEITAAESLGIGSRGAFYEKTGAVRDILQNHLMEVLALLAMEPPASLQADDIRAQKLALWQAIAPIPLTTAVRGQYGPGEIAGATVVGYRAEDNVAADSTTETYAAIELTITTPRWAGVPFHLRAGKRLNQQLTEVKITFKPTPTQLLAEANTLVLRLQPNPTINLHVGVKQPGPTSAVSPAALSFSYTATFGPSATNGYEKLFLDAMHGDATLFAHRDGVEATWALFTPLLEAWHTTPPTDFPNYAAGSAGPNNPTNKI